MDEEQFMIRACSSSFHVGTSLSALMFQITIEEVRSLQAMRNHQTRTIVAADTSTRKRQVPLVKMLAPVSVLV